MKAIKISLYVLLCIVVTLSSCDDQPCEEEWVYNTYTPVYKSMDEIRDSVLPGPPQDLKRTNGLYVYGDLLLIRDAGLGIHLYDNSNPASPKSLSFINMAGNQSMSVKSNMLYADNYMDLFVFDISDAANPNQVKRLDEVFVDHFAFQNELVVVEYVESEQTVIQDCSGHPAFFWFDDVFMVQGNLSTDVLTSTDGSAGNQAFAEVAGVGGSLAKFTVAHDRLYTINLSGVQVFDISNAACPIQGNEFFIGWSIETIFPFKQYLFFGSQEGMFIYDASDPDAPTYTSQFNHARVCDPVFATEDRAYVTLRNGTECWGFVNQLDVINIEDINNPSLIESYNMDNPHGLSVRDENLFICEGEYGFKIFDRTDDRNIDKNRITHVDDIHAYDVISLSEDHLIIVGDDGLYQYDNSDSENLVLLSLISTN